MKNQKRTKPKKKKCKRINQKRGWRDVFDLCSYSSGPGDNIYVYG